MATIGLKDRKIIERMLRTDSGYVLNFKSTHDFLECVKDSVGIDIYDEKYRGSRNGSMADRLLEFLRIESNAKVARLLEDLIYYDSTLESLDRGINRIPSQEEYALHCSFSAVLKKLSNEISTLNQQFANLDVSNTEQMQLLHQEINACANLGAKDSRIALDRLHTFATAYARGLCAKYCIPHEEDEALHSLWGKCIRQLEQTIHPSEATARILKTTISVFDSYNGVRNHKSLAHPTDNLLNQKESRLIIKYVIDTLNFALDVINNTN